MSMEGLRALSLRLGGFATRHAHLNWALVDQAVVSGANFLTTLIMARFLGVEAFGIFSLAWLIALFVQSIQMAFILTPMLTIGAKYSGEDADAYYASLIPLQVGFIVLSVLATVAIALTIGPAIGMGFVSLDLALVLSSVVATTQAHEYGRRFCFARGRTEVAFRIDAIRYLAQFAGFILLFSTGDGRADEALLVVAGSAVIGVATLGGDFPSTSWRGIDISRTLLRHWNMSRWLLPSALMQWTSSQFNILAAGAMLGPGAVGVMRAAQNLMGVTHVLFQALDNWGPIRAAQIYRAQGLAGLRAFIRRLLFLTGSLTVLALLALALPAEHWMNLLYGPNYRAYGWVVVFYGLGYLLVAMGVPFIHAFVAMEKTRPVFCAYLASTMITLSCFYPLIEQLGIFGAVAVFVVSMGILVGVLFWWYHK